MRNNQDGQESLLLAWNMGRPPSKKFRQPQKKHEKKQGPQSYKCKELNPANNPNDPES